MNDATEGPWQQLQQQGRAQVNSLTYEHHEDWEIPSLPWREGREMSYYWQPVKDFSREEEYTYFPSRALQ